MHAAPAANIAHVRLATLPLFGSMQCFTFTIESPSIAATSIALAPLASSGSPNIAAPGREAGSTGVGTAAAGVTGSGTGARTVELCTVQVPPAGIGGGTIGAR